MLQPGHKHYNPLFVTTDSILVKAERSGIGIDVVQPGYIDEGVPLVVRFRAAI
jgi:hypothetical protein